MVLMIPTSLALYWDAVASGAFRIPYIADGRLSLVMQMFGRKLWTVVALWSLSSSYYVLYIQLE